MRSLATNKLSARLSMVETGILQKSVTYLMMEAGWLERVEMRFIADFHPLLRFEKRMFQDVERGLLCQPLETIVIKNYYRFQCRIKMFILIA